MARAHDAYAWLHSLGQPWTSTRPSECHKVHQNAVLGAFLPGVGHQIVPENDLSEASVSELEGSVMGMEPELLRSG